MKTKNTVSVSPLWEGRDKTIWDVFVQPKLSHLTIEKNGSRKKTDTVINQYKEIFYKDKKLNGRVFVQGEPGNGKSTFLTKLALDWCEAVYLHTPGHKATFTDVDTFHKFKFLFHLSLRDATCQQHEVIEMIKTQIIDMIYTGDKREEVFNLLQRIMEKETCIVTLDGLNEWTYQMKTYVLPFMANCHTHCLLLISTRPWRMADERIKDSEIDTLLEIEGITDPEELTKLIIISLQIGNDKTHDQFMKYVIEHQLMPFMTSPWLQTLLVSLWMNNKALSCSLTEINCILLDLLFKKANAREGYFIEGTSIPCLFNTRYIKPHVDIFNSLAAVAFKLTYASIKSLVFTKCDLSSYMFKEQIEFCLNAGVLTQRYRPGKASNDSQFSFVHETVQEFFAAFHIANSKEDILSRVLLENKYDVLELSQSVIYLCGLDCEKANKLIKH
ncbi:hypothetical protein DPMN_067853 [Dreissena polymorpha]|uniref:NACHT domain-containing protein n=2 Tax=Dreissena polymorpha TaxID=45954 RepID=A0A9D3YWI3_DREPO|nr:hypothetical protein DPMN_067853 [Dreissena polymorpha]